MGKKKEQFRESLREKQGGGSGKGTIVGVIAGVLIAAAVGFTMLGGAGTASGLSTVKADGGIVKVPVAEVSDGLAHYYTYRAADGRAINFFVLKSSDGVIRSAFDACDVCFQAKKGYRQEGDEMVCNNCGQRFPSARINEVKGGCNPSPLNRAVEGQNVVFRASDIEGGGMYF